MINVDATFETVQLERQPTAIYFCGGTALNIGVELQDLKAPHCFVDTSDRNLTEKHDKSKVFLTEGTSGAGKNRKFIAPKIRPQINNILNRFPPADFNIVVSSTGGGSGSVIMPLIVSELIKKGETVVVVAISGTESTEVVDNSMNTIKTLEGISLTNGKVIPLVHLQNREGVPFTTINNEAEFYIHALCNLTTQTNERLDLQDVNNWINFNDKIGMQAQLCELHIFDNRHDANAVNEMISVASLYAEPEMEIAFGSPFVRTTGIMDSDNDELVAEQLHFVINTVGITEIMKELSDIKAEAHRHQSKYRARTALIAADENVDEDGFVF